MRSPLPRVWCWCWCWSWSWCWCLVLVPTTYYCVHGSPLRIDFVPVGLPYRFCAPTSSIEHLIQHLLIEGVELGCGWRALVCALVCARGLSVHGLGGRVWKIVWEWTSSSVCLLTQVVLPVLFGEALQKAIAAVYALTVSRGPRHEGGPRHELRRRWESAR